MARSVMGKMPTYKKFCQQNGYITKNGQLRFTAEICYRFISRNLDFEESHTGLEDVEIETPLCKMQGKKVDENRYAFVPILRAGTGMLDGIINLVPNAKIGHVGMYRDEQTFKPNVYYFKVPKDIDKREVLILDPMLATGGSGIDTIELLKEKGAKNIKFLCIIAAPEGIKAMQEKHPDVKIYTTSVDEKLNENAYIVPGLGDAGDRIFGTK